MSEPEIRYVPLSALRASPGNPKSHSIMELRRSIRRFGFVAPLIVKAVDGAYTVVAGHGRWEAIATMRDEEESPPGRIRVDADGAWLVPVLVCDFKDDDEARAYLLADNKLTETGGWNMKLLIDAVNTAKDLSGTGFKCADISVLMNAFAPKHEKDGSEVMDPVNAGARMSNICPECGYEWFTKRGKRGRKARHGGREFNE